MKFLKWLWKCGVVLAIIGVLFYGGLYLVAHFTPKLSIRSANGFYLYDNNDVLFTGNTQKDWISLDEISPHLINATLAVEDKKFYEHLGFDYLRIIKAMYENIKHGSYVQGASTITQQYAKNLFLDFDKKWSRKIEEAWLTIQLESHYSKDDILEGYLNTINYGGIFGIGNASKYYFNKSAKDLTLAEAAILAGIPKSPSYYSPLANPEAASSRQQLILALMEKHNYITEEERKSALKQELVYTKTKEEARLSTLMYYQDAVIHELKSLKTIPESFLKTGGLKIYTNLDMEAQEMMEESIDKNLAENAEAQVASIMMNPNTGAIIAIAGGRDYSKSQFNRVTSSKRQMGSTLKPFLYYSALENGFTPSTTFTSEKTTFTFSENKTYSPDNYGANYPNKPISMALALAYSDNIYAVKTHLFLGENTLVDMAKRVGIETDLEAVPSLALGSEELNLTEMVRAYATFANEGYKVKPHYIRKIEDMYGNVLYSYKPSKENVLNKSIVYVMNEMLHNCYDTTLIDYNSPTCVNIAPKITKRYAIKTGTTNTDHLVFGYNKDIIMGVWVGYDDNRESPLKDGTASKHIWVDTVEKYLKDKEDDWYQKPDNVVGVLVDPISGELANNDSKKKKILYYIKGTEPSAKGTRLDDAIPTIKENENIEAH